MTRLFLPTLLLLTAVIGNTGAFTVPKQQKHHHQNVGAASSGVTVVGDSQGFTSSNKLRSVMMMPPLNMRKFDGDLSINELEKVVTDEDIDCVLNKLDMGKNAGKVHNHDPIIPQYKPRRSWLLKRWKGTILQHGVKSGCVNMLIATVAFMLFKYATGATTWIRMNSCLKSTTNVWLARLLVFDKLWHYQMTLTTFILTFFVTKSYDFWRSTYNYGRKIQTYCNDINMLVASHIKRNNENNNNNSNVGGGGSYYDPNSIPVMKDVQSYIKSFTLLFWASQSRRLKMLLTKRGLNKMGKC